MRVGERGGHQKGSAKPTKKWLLVRGGGGTQTGPDPSTDKDEKVTLQQKQKNAVDEREIRG